MITKIEHFTAAIQLITAVNFTFILTHLPQYIFDQISGYDIICRKNFRRFRDNRLTTISKDIDNMKVVNIDGVETSPKRSLKDKVDKINDIWSKCENKSISSLDRLRKVKGFKCLFLFISVYCVFDLIAIPALSQWGNDYLITLVSLINIFAIIHTLKLSWIIHKSKWDTKHDKECYNRTILFLIFTFLGIIPVWALAHFTPILTSNNVFEADIVSIIKWLWNFDIWMCLLLPFYPYAFSILYIFGTIISSNAKRMMARGIIWWRIRDLGREKKKFDDAYDILKKISWGE